MALYGHFQVVLDAFWGQQGYPNGATFVAVRGSLRALYPVRSARSSTSSLRGCGDQTLPNLSAL